MAKARVEIEYIDPKEAAAKIEQISAAERRLKSDLDAGSISAQQYGRSTERLGAAKKILASNTSVGSTAIRRMTADQRQAAEAAQLLGARLGVQLPRSVNNFIAQSKLIGPALQAAFSATIFLAVGAAVVALIAKIPELTDKLFDWSGALKKLMEDVKDTNTLLLKHQEKMKELRREYELIGLSGPARLAKQLQFQNADLETAQLNFEKLGGKIKDLQREANDTAPAIIRAGDSLTGAGQVMEQVLTPAAIRAQQALGPLVSVWLRMRAEMEAAREAAKNAGKELGNELAEKKLAALAEQLNRVNAGLLELREGLILARQPLAALPGLIGATVEGDPALIGEILRKREQERELLQGLLSDVQALHLAQLKGIPHVVAELEIELSALDALKQKHIDNAQVVELLTQKEVLLRQDASRRIAEENKQAFEQMSQQIEAFFSQVFLTARSFGDVWKQLTQQLVRLFVTAISRMVAAWLLGMRQMQSASAGGFGGSGEGGIGGAIASLFGLGGGGGGGFGIAGPGGTAVFNPAASSFAGEGGFGVTGGTNLSGQRISLGGAAASAIGPLATGGGGGSATNIGLLGSLFGKLGIKLHDLKLGKLTVGGEALALGGLLVGLTSGFSAFKSGSPLTGALGGAAGGAMFGFSVGGPIGAAIGAIVGGIAGLLSGIFGKGKLKKKASRIAEAGFDEMRKVVEEFKRFQVDFEGALGGVDAIWAQMQDAWRQLGGSIFRRSVRGELPEFQSIRKEIETLQQAREARGELLRALPIPEFAVGGFVNAINARDGKLLAFLHQGEAVLNQRAVASLGRGAIEQMNRAPSFQAGGFVGHSPRAGSFVLNVERGAIVINGVSDPEGAADLAVRKLERLVLRKARDKGLPAPW